jgi:hypothetical protein
MRHKNKPVRQFRMLFWSLSSKIKYITAVLWNKIRFSFVSGQHLNQWRITCLKRSVNLFISKCFFTMVLNYWYLLFGLHLSSLCFFFKTTTFRGNALPPSSGETYIYSWILSIELASICGHRCRFNLRTGEKAIPRNVVVLKRKQWRWIKSKKTDNSEFIFRLVLFFTLKKHR